MALETLVDRLLFEEEGNTLDFKSEQYRFSGATDEEKSELLKDIVAFANAWRRADAYILIGVKEIKGGRSQVIGITVHLDDAHLQQFINSKTQRPVDFSYKTVQHEGVPLGIIHIPVQRRPFYLQKDFGRLKKSQVYIRRGSSTDVASIDEVSTMGGEVNGTYRDAPTLDAYLIFGEHDEIIEKNIACKLINASVPDDEQFPDYGVEYANAGFNLKIQMPNFSKNKDYYRDRAKYLQAHWRVCSFKLGIKNLGAVAARDVKAIFDIADEGKTSIACRPHDLPSEPQYDTIFLSHLHNAVGKVPDVNVKRTTNGWRITCFLGKIQAKDIAITRDCFCLGATKSKSIRIDAQVFSDDLPEPKKETLEIGFDVEDRAYSVKDILPNKI